MKMNCEEAQELLDAHSLGALDRSEARRLEKHLASCLECRRLQQVLQVLLAEGGVCEGLLQDIDGLAAPVQLVIEHGKAVAVPFQVVDLRLEESTPRQAAEREDGQCGRGASPTQARRREPAERRSRRHLLS